MATSLQGDLESWEQNDQHSILLTLGDKNFYKREMMTSIVSNDTKRTNMIYDKVELCLRLK